MAAAMAAKVAMGAATGAAKAAGIEVPTSVMGVDILPQKGLKGMAHMLGVKGGDAGTVYMRQQWSMMEAATGGIMEAANVYDIYNNEDLEKTHKIGQVQARSTNCERCICAPNHSIMLHVNDNHGNTMVTFQRKGFGSGKYCLGGVGCCAICDWCQDGIIIHEGKVTAEPACCNMGNKCCDGCGHGDLTNPNPVSKAEVPCCGGGCGANIDIFEDFTSTSPNGRMSGPFCFGGFTELCCESKFFYKTSDGRSIGRIRKLVPTSIGQCMQEICTDSDRFKVDFYQGSSEEEKANTMALGLLADYMYFERDLGMVSCVCDDPTHPKLRFTCCLYICCGDIYPCAFDVDCSESSDEESSAASAMECCLGGPVPEGEEMVR